MALPPCGIYRTTAPIGGIPAGRLVYFHNHGDPGPGVYLPTRWTNNRASWDSRGTTLPDPERADGLEPLPAEGFYVVTRSFTCCEKECRTFTEDSLVQVGYNGAGDPIVFVPTLTATGVEIPDTGSKTSVDRLRNLKHIKVAENRAEPALATPPSAGEVH